jgi:hypothetical protein
MKYHSLRAIVIFLKYKVHRLRKLPLAPDLASTLPGKYFLAEQRQNLPQHYCHDSPVPNKITLNYTRSVVPGQQIVPQVNNVRLDQKIKRLAIHLA